MENRQVRFDALDSWRGIAALVVALFHFQAAGSFYDLAIVRHGNLAVPFFFVLSGFVITHAYRSNLNDRGDGLRFVIRRFGRLYPLHFFTLMILVGLELLKLIASQFGFHGSEGPFQNSNSIPALIANVFLLHAVIPFPDVSWNAASWSISTEFYTYLIFLLVYLASPPRRRVLAAFGTFCLAGCFLLYLELTVPQLNVAAGMGMAQCVFGFFAGNLTYESYLRLRGNPLVTGTLPELFATIVMFLLFWIKPRFISGDIIAFGVVILLFAVQGGAISRWMRNRVLQRLGELSYSIYLLHFIVFALMFVAVRLLQAKTGWPLLALRDGLEIMTFGPPWVMDLVAFAYLCVVIVLAMGTYRWIEVPGRRMFNRLANRTRAAADGTSVVVAR
jgi:peptidoglycan/LPS O-acetylase OafA/YrhL